MENWIERMKKGTPPPQMGTVSAERKWSTSVISATSTRALRHGWDFGSAFSAGGRR